jgi:hypothetical protein
MKIYSETELAAIEECAKMGLSKERTSKIIDIPYYEFVYNPIVVDKYNAGLLQSLLDLNRKISALAQNGSAAAQSEMRKIHQEQEIRNFMMTLDE